ncbi:MAG TPA: hypothetical protein VKX25_00785 [Bryobacteraceae bacterium]|jgi:hypothetical protein|nr:hypothetical protein [Bryobacteraceae bacterium]
MSTPAQIHANQANASFSTGPRTEQGKERSSQNSFKHGIYSKALILPTENPLEFKELRDALYAEYQPATTTETLLVDELLHNAWRIRRFRRLEITALDAPHCEAGHDLKLMSLVERALASSERAFHRTLTTLRKLQKDRQAENGFVPAKPELVERTSTSAADGPHPPSSEIGFVPEKTQHPVAAAPSPNFIPRSDLITLLPHGI